MYLIGAIFTRQGCRGSALAEFALVLTFTLIGSIVSFRLVLDKYGGHSYAQSVMQGLESIRNTAFDAVQLGIDGQPRASSTAIDALAAMSKTVGTNAQVSQVCSALLRARQDSSGAPQIEVLATADERARPCYADPEHVPQDIKDRFEESLVRDFGGAPSTMLYGPEVATVSFMIDDTTLHSFYRVDPGKSSR